MSRYAPHAAEDEAQPGSGGLVLRNLAGITAVEDMDDLELALLAQLYENVLVEELPDRALSVADIKHWHRRWLGNVYEWAGQERSVNMGKGGFNFAAAAQIPRLLAGFEAEVLQRWTPCDHLSHEGLVEAIAVSHVELILIHPFREGNGRLSRLLADVMAVQAGRNPLDYSSWESHKAGYIAAIHAGVAMNYEPMKFWVRRALNL
ncbi:Fic/DOC family protein [Curvibacter gracilis]|uniref:Fic/DOC family protein n=1 Tax=Curvibacter gracilis TaxID=230310 RepID=UPI000484D733|nr:Fic family protein [Curvibacter gracilis]